MIQNTNATYATALSQEVKGARIEKVSANGYGNQGGKAYNLTLAVETGKTREDGTPRLLKRYATVFASAELILTLDAALVEGAYLTGSGRVIANDYTDQKTGETRESEKIALNLDDLIVTRMVQPKNEVRQHIIGGTIEKATANPYGQKGEKAYNFTVSIPNGKAREDGTPRVFKRRCTIFAAPEKQAFLDAAIQPGAQVAGEGYVIPDDYKDQKTGETRYSEKIIMPADGVIILGMGAVPVQQAVPQAMPVQPTAQPVMPQAIPQANPNLASLFQQTQPVQTAQPVQPQANPNLASLFQQQTQPVQPVQPAQTQPMVQPQANPNLASLFQQTQPVQPVQPVTPQAVPQTPVQPATQPVQPAQPDMVVQTPASGLPWAAPTEQPTQPATQQTQPVQPQAQPAQTTQTQPATQQAPVSADDEFEKYQQAVSAMPWS